MATTLPTATKAPVNPNARVFKHVMPSAQFVTASGTLVTFMGHTALVDNLKTISELEAEIEGGNTYLSQGTAAEHLVAQSGDPLAAIREKMREELLAELAAQAQAVNRGDADVGTSDQSGGRMVTTTTMAAVIKK